MALAPLLPVVTEEFLEAFVDASTAATLRTAKGLQESEYLLFGSPAGRDIAAPEAATDASATAVTAPTAASAANAVAPQALPSGWSMAIDPASNKPYFFDAAGKSQWDAPALEKKRKISPQQLLVDSECGFGGKILLTPDGSYPYNVTLNMVDATTCKYYVMQLVETHRKE